MAHATGDDAMTQSRDTLSQIYALSIDSGRPRLPRIEQFLGISQAHAISIDDRRNERQIYQLLAENYLDVLDLLLQELLRELRADAPGAADDVLDGLDFLQSVVASILWRHGHPVGERLEAFAREFDRLDVPSERLRLYQAVQNEEW
ncbi:MAG TPA: hypothetical protein VJ276_04175 [Thermoanaerobaculia bacterium]|nr:hypothetical protein [Thermoanaerobaculia bacterium]